MMADKQQLTKLNECCIANHKIIKRTANKVSFEIFNDNQIDCGIINLDEMESLRQETKSDYIVIFSSEKNLIIYELKGHHWRHGIEQLEETIKFVNKYAESSFKLFCGLSLRSNIPEQTTKQKEKLTFRKKLKATLEISGSPLKGIVKKGADFKFLSRGQ